MKKIMTIYLEIEMTISELLQKLKVEEGYLVEDIIISYTDDTLKIITSKEVKK